MAALLRFEFTGLAADIWLATTQLIVCLWASLALTFLTLVAASLLFA
jgi:hypothetical protein